ncbi:MAG: hypothetical protein GXO62_05925 [Epsilonproteobacteria bacterium]|nr:hypothetical protein [Campylobacterota bacterium]
MNKDIVSKDVIKSVLKELINTLLGLEVNEINLVEEEFERVESRRADIVAIADNEKIVHIEIQTAPDKTMPLRMLRYYTDIKTKFPNYPVYQFVIFLGKGKMPNSLKDVGLDYRYELIDMKKIDCEIFLSKNRPEDLVLAILCDFKGKNPKDVVEYIIDKLISITDENGYKKFMIILEEFSGLRDLEQVVKEKEMVITNKVRLEELPSYMLGAEIEKRDNIIRLYNYTKDIEMVSKVFDIPKEEIKKILKEAKNEKH